MFAETVFSLCSVCQSLFLPFDGVMLLPSFRRFGELVAISHSTKVPIPLFTPMLFKLVKYKSKGALVRAKAIRKRLSLLGRRIMTSLPSNPWGLPVAPAAGPGAAAAAGASAAAAAAAAPAPIALRPLAEVAEQRRLADEAETEMKRLQAAAGAAGSSAAAAGAVAAPAAVSGSSAAAAAAAPAAASSSKTGKRVRARTEEEDERKDGETPAAKKGKKTPTKKKD
jgi:hypothetical protein